MALEGAADALRKIDPANVERLRQVALLRILLVLESNIKRVTPVKTGALRRSITHQVVRPGERGAVGTNLIYARPVNVRRQYMQRGIKLAEQEISEILRAAGLRAWSGDVE